MATEIIRTAILTASGITLLALNIWAFAKMLKTQNEDFEVDKDGTSF